MMARTTSITIQNLVEIARRTSAWEDEMWCFSLFIYVCNAPALNGHKLRSCFIEERIASVFLGRFRCGLQLFFGDEMPFTKDKTNLKIVARRGYDWCDNARGNFQNLRKWVQSLCAPLRPFRSELKENFYDDFLLHLLHPYKNISLPRFISLFLCSFVPECPRKFSKSEKMGAKFVRTISTIEKRAERKFLPHSFTSYIVDVHPYKNISLSHYGVPQKTVNL